MTINCMYCEYYDDCTIQMEYYCTRLKTRIAKLKWERMVINDDFD